jgi:hypothetical protein
MSSSTAHGVRQVSGAQEFKELRPERPQLELKITLIRLDNLKEYPLLALLDCGVTGSTINQGYVEQHNIPTEKLAKPIPVYNADGTPNANGPIKECVHARMRINQHEEQIELAVSNLTGHDVFLGYEWLQHHNPTVNWTSQTLEFDRCPSSCVVVTSTPKIEYYRRVYSWLEDCVDNPHPDSLLLRAHENIST